MLRSKSFLMVLLTTAPAQSVIAQTDIADCYGPSLEVQLAPDPLSEFELSMREKEPDRVFPPSSVARLSIPLAGNKEQWMFIGPGQTQEYPLALEKCMAEPVDLKHISGQFADDPKSDSLRPRDPGDILLYGVTLKGTHPDSHVKKEEQDTLAGWIERGGTLREDGFVHIEGSDTSTPFNGLWRFPEDYSSPVGAPIQAMCLHQCWVNYRITPNIELTYFFAVLEGMDEPDWIAIDTEIRCAVFGWFQPPIAECGAGS